MGKFNLILIILLISVLVLAILMLALGMSSGILNGEPQELFFQSREGQTQPELGYVTPVYDPWTTVTVTVESDEPVEVLLYSSNYRGGRVIRNEDNASVIRDEWLTAGEKAQRVGTNVVLSDFTSVSNQYMVDVVVPHTSEPSDVDYTIRIEADTTINLFLFYLSLILLALFAIMMVYRRVSSKEERSKVTEERPSYAGSYQQGQWNSPPPVPHQPPPPPPPVAPPPPPPVAPPPPPPNIPPQGRVGPPHQSQEHPSVE